MATKTVTKSVGVWGLAMKANPPVAVARRVYSWARACRWPRLFDQARDGCVPALRGGWGRCKGGIRRRHIAAGFRSIAPPSQGFITRVEQVALGLGPPVEAGGGIFESPGRRLPGLHHRGVPPVGGCAGRRGGHLAALGHGACRRVSLKAVPPPAPPQSPATPAGYPLAPGLALWPRPPSPPHSRPGQHRF
jgi:hypothetical protein